MESVPLKVNHMEQFQLIGHPLGHSMSPPIHERLFALEEREAAYTLNSFPPEQFESHLAQLMALDGFNITIPYKQTILPHLDELHQSARLYGAVNTVRRLPDGRHIGYNTDCDGFLRTMSAHGVSLDTRVCVLGAGGVGRMFAIECARQGGDVTVAVRESGRSRAEALRKEIAEQFGRKISLCDIASPEGRFGLLINATPVGMFPKVDACPVPESFLTSVDAVFDCIYNPAETLLLRRAKTAGCLCMGGMHMLVWQAAVAHEYWHGCSFDNASVDRIVDEMHEILLRKEREA